MMANLFRLILVVVGLRIVCLRMETMISGPASAMHAEKYSFSVSHVNEGSVTPDEQRVAQRFVKDTLPGLIRKGLITRYERNPSGTRIVVSGLLWKNRSTFFKQSFMAALLVYDKVEKFHPHARVVDGASGTLYAEISPESKISFYD